MENWYENYEAMISSQPVCDDTWFPEAMAKYQNGDDGAGRAISGSCLRLAMRIAEQRAPEFSTFPLLDLIQEANAGLVDALKTFDGTSAAEFVQHATRAIHHRLESLATVP